MFTLPPATIENTIPPVLNRRYFDNAPPFLLEGREYSPARAWWLAEAALLAYADPGFAVGQFAAAGLTVDTGQTYSAGSTQLYIVYDDRKILVVFRGTELPKSGTTRAIATQFQESWMDIAADAKFPRKPALPRGEAHGGFVDAWAGVSKKVLDRVAELKAQNPARSVWFTGHSLGAALAVLAAAQYGAADGLYTYGSPRVGDATFTASLTCPAFRHVHNNDAVPNLPIAYLHAGTLHYFGRDGEPGEEPGLFTSFLRGTGDFFGSLSGLFSQDATVFPRSSLTDHAPLYYALLTRHALDTRPGR